MTYELTAGSPANLQLVAKTPPPPAPGEVSVAVRAIGLNFADVFAGSRISGEVAGNIPGYILYPYK